MKKEYDFSKLKKRPKPTKALSSEETKIPISIRLDGCDVADLKTEAYRLGIPYQTFIGSVLHRYVTGELIDKKSAEMAKILKELAKGA
jgi:predicted DNA binding CopG/RHH family protein